ncbi:MAG TPA: HD domain-containing protein, partial [Phenylobacterium sp.]|nr:HD domain-containing protein [Phenylobacterium sp.]
TIEAIFELYDRNGARHYGEGVSQLEHALQCAQLATLDGAGDALVAAALLHDLGHLLESEGALSAEADARHEVRGATALRPLFGPEVIQPIALHVAAKRYLCATEAGYYDGLSEASRQSLRLQGGPLSAHQARRFEGGAYFAEAVRLRRYDEDGKLDGAASTPLRDYGDLLSGLCARDAPVMVWP